MISTTSATCGKNISVKAKIFTMSHKANDVAVLQLGIDDGNVAVDVYFPSPDLLTNFCNDHAIEIDDRREVTSNKGLSALEQIKSAPKYKLGYARGSLAFWQYVDFEIEMVRPVNEHPEYLKGWDRGVLSQKAFFNQAEENKGVVINER